MCIVKVCWSPPLSFALSLCWQLYGVACLHHFIWSTRVNTQLAWERRLLQATDVRKNMESTIWSSSSFLPRLFRKPTTKNFLPPRLPFLIPPGLLGAIFVGTAIRKQSVLRQYSKTFGFFASQGPMLLSRTGLKNFADKTEYHRYISLYATITVLK